MIVSHNFQNDFDCSYYKLTFKQIFIFCGFKPPLSESQSEGRKKDKRMGKGVKELKKEKPRYKKDVCLEVKGSLGERED